MATPKTSKYRIDEQSGARPFKTLDENGVVIGTSMSREKAERFIQHRLEGDERKRQR